MKTLKAVHMKLLSKDDLEDPSSMSTAARYWLPWLPYGYPSDGLICSILIHLTLKELCFFLSLHCTYKERIFNSFRRLVFVI